MRKKYNDIFADMLHFDARNKEDARKLCADRLKELGCGDVELSTTSEEV